MRSFSKRLVLLVTLALIAAASLFAQNSLFDNQNYRRSLQLQQMSKTAYDSGDYLKAAEYSAEAAELSRIARAEAEAQLLLWNSNAWKNRAGTRIAYGEKLDAATRYADVWAEAKASYALALSQFEAKSYESSIEASKKTIKLLEVLEPMPKVVAAKPAPAKPVAEALPAFYVVRLLEPARDCLWRIAEYSFVYGDPWQWKVLYEANKDKMPSPDDPDLIHARHGSYHSKSQWRTAFGHLLRVIFSHFSPFKLASATLIG
ncbi:DUF4398 domain-containing protein [Treponema sp.]